MQFGGDLSYRDGAPVYLDNGAPARGSYLQGNLNAIYILGPSKLAASARKSSRSVMVSLCHSAGGSTKMLAAPPQLSDGSTTWRKGVAEPARARTQIEPNRLMSLAAVLLTPLILLLPVSGAVDEDSASRDDRPVAASGQAASTRLGTPQPATSASDPWEGWTFSDLAESFRVRSQEQVRKVYSAVPTELKGHGLSSPAKSGK